MENLTIRRCTREEYPELLEVLNTAFGFGTEFKWFHEHMQHCTPPEEMVTDEEIRNAFIAKLDDKIIGTAGIYPFNWIVSDGIDQYTLKAFGVGQVSCLPEYREKGVMTSLLKHTQTEMAETKSDVKFLIGDRFRYRRFGYENGANIVELVFNKRSFVAFPETEITYREATVDDIEKLNEMYQTYPSYLERSDLKWKRHIEYPSGKFYIGEKDGKEGYLSFNPRWFKVSCEAVGDPEVVLQLIRNYLNENEKVENVTVQLPYTQIPTPLTRALHAAAFQVSLRPYGHLAFFDFDGLFEKLAPTVERQCGRPADSFDKEQREAIIRRLFGFVYDPLPQCIEDLTDLQPLCAWVPDLDNM